MSTDWDLVIKIAGPIIGAAVGAAAKQFFEGRADVVAFLQHVAGINFPNADPPQAIGTHTIVLTNTGGKPATNVRLGHNILPTFAIAPGVDYTVNALPNGQQEIRIPTLIPKKQLTITYLYAAPVQWQQVNTHLEHDGGPVRVLAVLPSVQRPAWMRRMLWALAGIGSVTAVYLFVELAMHVYGGLGS